MGRVSVCQKTGLKRGTWTPEEDAKLCAYVRRYGHLNWRLVPAYAGLSRCGKSCRLRWMNYLRPNIKRGGYTAQEEEIIVRMHKQIGNRWSVIAACLPGRTDNEVKNYWHTQLKRRSDQQPREPKEAKLKTVVHEILGDADHHPSGTRPLILESSGLIPVSTSTSSDFLSTISNHEGVIIENKVGETESGVVCESSEIMENENLNIQDSYMSSTSGPEDVVTEYFSVFDLDFWNETFGLQDSYVSSTSGSEGVVLDNSVLNGAKSEVSSSAASEFALDHFWDEPFVLPNLYMSHGSGSEGVISNPASNDENEISSDNTAYEIDGNFWLNLF